jgi:hypothetical protein
MISVKETNELIKYASKVFDKLFANRFLIESQLFPVSEYIMVSCVNSYEKFYDQLKRLTEKISPEEIARREAGKLFTEITPLQIFNIQMFPCFGRTVRISNLYKDNPMREPKEKFNQIRFILDFWQRLAKNYYDGSLTIDEMGGTCQIASRESLNLVKNKLEKIDPDKLKNLRHMIAHLDQLAFLDECETRMKISNHGPYYISEKPDEFIVIKEIVRLYDGKTVQWPWSETDAEAPYSNILVAYQLKGDIECYYNDWGTLTTKPTEIKDKITKYCLLSKKGNKIIELDEAIIKEFRKYAQLAHKELYLKYAKWTKLQRLEAGALVYNKNFDRFTNLVGITDKIDWSLTDNVKNQELKRFLKNKIEDFSCGNWIMRSNRKRKIHPTYFVREEIDLKKAGSFYK